jgi:hypothetical protein
MILVVGNEDVSQLPPQYARIQLQGQGRLEQDHHNLERPAVYQQDSGRLEHAGAT